MRKTIDSPSCTLRQPWVSVLYLFLIEFHPHFVGYSKERKKKKVDLIHDSSYGFEKGGLQTVGFFPSDGVSNGGSVTNKAAIFSIFEDMGASLICQELCGNQQGCS